MYARGTVSEMSLDKVHVGDKVTGTLLEDYSTQFTATITEISLYPESGNNYYWGGGENANSSYYPFYAYIEDGDNLPEGDCELVLRQEEETGAQICLPAYLVRTEDSGKSYVFIRDDQGLLKKKYIRTGKSIGGYSVQVLSGLHEDDLIAFPYGKGVQDGAKTREVESFYGESFYSYG